MPGVTSLNSGARISDAGPGNYKARVQTLTASTTLDYSANNVTFLLNTASGFTVTLPPAVGSGVAIYLLVKTTVTSNNYVIATQGSDTAIAVSHVAATDASGAMKGFTKNNAVTATLNGTTTGGIVGDVIELQDIASGVWQMVIWGTATGTLATPFA